MTALRGFLISFSRIFKNGEKLIVNVLKRYPKEKVTVFEIQYKKTKAYFLFPFFFKE
jgi:hypothetical protein